MAQTGHVSHIECFRNDHKEADYRIFKHVRKSACTEFVVTSPDCDTMHVGFGLLSQLGDRHVFMKLHSQICEDCFLDLNGLVDHLHNDFDIVCGISDTVLDEIAEIFR